jgi:peptide/nickel transport system ATP-binding protein
VRELTTEAPARPPVPHLGATVPAQGPAAVVRGMAVSFDTADGPLRAVDGVSFELAAGRSLGVVGESGSGKSVLSRSMMGLLPRTAHVAGDAQVVIAGRDVRDVESSRERHVLGVDVAMIFQDPMSSLTPTKKIGELIAEPIRYHLPLNRKQAKARAIELLEAVGIPDPQRRARQYPHSLSGGMRQRVMIATALACEPKLLIADEPTSALDVTIQHQILTLLSRLQADLGMAMILVTHDLGVVARHTDDVAVMYGGRFVERAPTKVLLREMRHPYTQALFGAIPKMSNKSHTRVTAIRGRPPRLIGPSRPGCSFAPRCPRAQPRCLSETPTLQTDGNASHEFACFFPVGSTAGAEALAANIAHGRNAAGLRLAEADAV